MRTGCNDHAGRADVLQVSDEAILHRGVCLSCTLTPKETWLSSPPQGVFEYDFGDTAGLTPLLKMHTLGHDFIPDRQGGEPAGQHSVDVLRVDAARHYQSTFHLNVVPDKQLRVADAMR